MKRRRAGQLATVLLALLLSGSGRLLTSARGQETAPQLAPAPAAGEPAAPAAQPTPKKKKVQVKRADSLYYDAATKTYHLTGNIIMVHEDMTLYCDKCDYNDKENTAVATGSLKMQDSESTVTGDKIEADFDEKLVRVTSNVSIVTQKKPKEGEAPPPEGEGLDEFSQKRTTITCPQLDYYYAEDKKQATVTGPVKAMQEDKTVFADQAFYDGVKDEVTLEGNVKVITESGSEFRCPKAVISLQDDWIKAENITGIAVTEEEEEGAPEGGEPAPPPAPPAD